MNSAHLSKPPTELKKKNRIKTIHSSLEIIFKSSTELLNIQNFNLTNIDRINLFKTIFKGDFFTRKEYLLNFKNISSATASRDLKFATENDIIEKLGEKSTTKYRCK